VELKQRDHSYQWSQTKSPALLSLFMTSNTCLAGRGNEIRRLTCAYADRRHTLIVGPAGTGKTALLMEAQKRFGILLCRHRLCGPAVVSQS
jgi:MoxR-like ATPase